MKTLPTKENTLVIIPILNEQKTIKGVINKIKNSGYNNIVSIIDGSVDNSQSIAESLNIRTLVHKKNKGTGAAIKTGIQYGIDNGYTYFLTIDGDDQHNPSDLHLLMEQLEVYDHTIGSRFLNPDNKVPWTRNKANQFANIILLLKGIRTTDSQSGLTGFNLDVGNKMIDVKANRFEFWSATIIKIRKNTHFQCSEIPISVRYTSYSLKKGQSLREGIWTIIKLLFL